MTWLYFRQMATSLWLCSSLMAVMFLAKGRYPTGTWPMMYTCSGQTVAAAPLRPTKPTRWFGDGRMLSNLLPVLARLLQSLLQPLELPSRVGHVSGGFVGAVVEDGVEADQAQARLHPLGVVAACGDSRMGERLSRATGGKVSRRASSPLESVCSASCCSHGCHSRAAAW